MRTFLFACVFVASAEAQLTIGPGSAAFVDISTTGTALLNAGDDTGHGFTSTIGNDLLPAGPLVVSSNGHVVSGLLTISGTPFDNAAITGTTTASMMSSLYPAGGKVVCAWWDDLLASGAPNTTLYWKETGNTLYIQWQNVGHYNTAGGAGGPAITFQIQVVQESCGLSAIHMVYPDAVFGGAQAANDLAASATIGCIGGSAYTNAQWSHNTAGAIQNGTSLTITFHQLTTTWSSPSGPGSLKLEMCGGTFGGSYQILVTLNPGLYPAGWLLGIDITIPELMSQFGHVPFRGPLGPSGSATIGPFTGLPHGLTIYSVFLDYPPGASLPATIVPAFAYTIP